MRQSMPQSGRRRPVIKKYLGKAAARLIREATQPQVRQLRELEALGVLQFNLQQTGFDTLLFPGGYAANASLLLEVFQVLETFRPNAVLECGSGESTGILAHYARRHPDCRVVSLEDQPNWSARVRRRFFSGGMPDNFRLVTAPLGSVNDKDGVEHVWYAGAEVDQALSQRRFELVLVDGPSGRSGAGRRGLLSRFPELIAEQFALYFDDASSTLYGSDVTAIRDTLNRDNRDFVMRTLEGAKQVAVFVSSDLQDIVGSSASG